MKKGHPFFIVIINTYNSSIIVHGGHSFGNVAVTQSPVECLHTFLSSISGSVIVEENAIPIANPMLKTAEKRIIVIYFILASYFCLN